MKHARRWLRVLCMAAIPAWLPVAAAQTLRYPAGKSAFDGKCAICHQPGGNGMDGLAPPLTGYPGRYAQAQDGRAQLAHTLLYGMFGPIKVNGKTYDFKMPSFAALADAQIADLLNYVVFDLNAQRGDAKPFDAAEIRAMRVSPLDAAAVHRQRDALVERLGL